MYDLPYELTDRLRSDTTLALMDVNNGRYSQSDVQTNYIIAHFEFITSGTFLEVDLDLF